MIKRLRRPMLVIGTIILMMQAVSMTIIMGYAETTIDPEQHEQVELPSMKNYIEEQTSRPHFFFTQSRIQGLAEETLQVMFFSDQEVSEAQILLPEEATILKDQLLLGISVEEGSQPNEWIVQTKHSQNTFVLPLVFEKTGSYELSVEETTAQIEISEQEEASEEVPAEETKASDNEPVGQEELEDSQKSEQPEEVREPVTEASQEQKIVEEDQLVSGVDREFLANNDFNTIVTANNFLDYFGFSGSAYVNGNIVTLTEQINNQSGSMYLKNKIDSTYPFLLTGKVFLGSRNISADGIGFGFHRDNPDSVGLVGSGFGLAGLTDIFGFKLDTYYNGTNSSPFRPDPINTGAFGAFVYMDNNWFTSYTGNDAPARSISRPTGLWHEITVSLTEDGVLIIDYENMVWEKELPRSLVNEDLSFLVSASTGGVNALQQFQFDSFSYSRSSSIVSVNYIDDTGIELEETETLSGLIGDEYQTNPKVIDGYILTEIPDNASGIFKEEEQVINYIYSKIEPIAPVDPLDPETEVDPENKPEVPENQGLLSLDFASQFNFGSQVISAKDEVYFAQPQRLLNADGTVNEEEERPNYVQVTDRRSEAERNGWQLAVTQNKQFETSTGHELAGARIRLTNQQLATAQGGSEPEFQQTNPLALVPGQRRLLLMAQGEEGTGTWVYRFGDQSTAGESVALEVPRGANPEATTYKTTLTWELSAIPDN